MLETNPVTPAAEIVTEHAKRAANKAIMTIKRGRIKTRLKKLRPMDEMCIRDRSVPVLKYLY